MNRLGLFVALFVASGAHAAQIVPPEPIEFETVNLRLATDACSFVASTVRVASAANALRVTQQPNPCLVAGPVRIVDIRLGSFPAGDYTVELYATPQPSGPPVERLSFQVRGRVEIAVFPPPVRPLADFSGLWWAPGESGWGLFLAQSALTNIVFGAWFVYGPDGRPEWFTLQDGRWTSFTTWTATVYRTSGPPPAAFDARLVRILPVGAATIDFTQSPGTEGRARFTYDVSGLGTDTKTIQRFVY